MKGPDKRPEWQEKVATGEGERDVRTKVIQRLGSHEKDVGSYSKSTRKAMKGFKH